MEEQIMVKYGEITNTPLYQVRGDPHWFSTPALAKRAHKALKEAAERNFFNSKDRKKG